MKGKLQTCSSVFKDMHSDYCFCLSLCSDIKGFLELDLGPNAEFYFLREKCYEMTDREYVYKLCPFDKATQRQKSGGAETTLG